MPRACPCARRCSRSLRPERRSRSRRRFQGGSSVLIITRRAGEKIMLGDEVAVEVMEIVGNQVRVGIRAPRSVRVYREELWDAVKRENLAAADSALELPRPAAP